jgi:hypothetical protein
VTHNLEAVEARVEQDRRRLAVCDEIEALILEVRVTHPTATLAELAELLPEPRRLRLLVLLDELPEIVPFPSEGNVASRNAVQR